MEYRRIIPNSISGTNLILGVLSIFESVAGNFEWAAIYIILAVAVDACDGRAARALGVAGKFGVEMDSLCDVCSFGVAHAVMMYYYGMTDFGICGQLIAALFPVWGALRLARFNINADVIHGYFQGMPIPGGACVLAAFVLSGYDVPQSYVAVLTFVIGCILYSTIRYPDFKGKGNPLFKVPVIIGLAIGAYIFYLRPEGWPFVIMFTYTLIGIINAVYVKALHKQ